LKINLRFGGTRPLHLQGREIQIRGNQHEKGGSPCYLFRGGLLLGFFFDQCSAFYLSHIGFLLGHFSTQKVQATYSSETSVDFQRTTRHYIPEYRAINFHHS
jgi:hypothetical protein